MHYMIAFNSIQEYFMNYLVALMRKRLLVGKL